MKKRSVSINGHRTSYSIEDEFQSVLEAMAGQRGVSLAKIISEVDSVQRENGGLSSAIRVHILSYVLGQNSTAVPMVPFPTV